ncbi:uncharacterized protein [Euwallacea similis]|uniref:uncharacterized protein n=1 Tax=Euwallacea similis TaxID=1736056 RepID=UPI00344F898B
MKGVPTVRKLDEFLQQLLKPTEKIVDKQLSRFTSPGENYVSVLLRIVIKIEDTKTRNERTIDSVAKLVPETELVEGLFEINQTVGAEFHYYHSIVPAFDKFLKSQGFPEGADFAVQFYCGRLGLTDPKKADKDGIILLKNLRNDGYYVGASKFEGLDLASTKVVLDSLAKFHAAGIGYRYYYPDSFEEKLKLYIYTFNPEHLASIVFTTLIHTLEVSNEFSKEEIETIKAMYSSDHKNFDKNLISDVWRTMIHSDIWTNNIIIKYVKSEPVQAKLIDFQFYDYGTPSNDVIFFLLTSIKQSILEDQLDDLLDYYYKTLLKNLKKMDVIEEKFSKESFNEEIKLAMKNKEYFHILWMSQPLMEESFSNVGALKDQHPNQFLEWTEEHVYKVKYISRLCLERGWF